MSVVITDVHGVHRGQEESVCDQVDLCVLMTRTHYQDDRLKRCFSVIASPLRYGL